MRVENHVKKAILFWWLIILSPAIVLADSDYSLAPDGVYVSDGHPTLAPDGMMGDN